MPAGSASVRSAALRSVLLIGGVSLFADFTHEGVRSVTGPFLATLGASGGVVGVDGTEARRERWGPFLRRVIGMPEKDGLRPGAARRSVDYYHRSDCLRGIRRPERRWKPAAVRSAARPVLPDHAYCEQSVNNLDPNTR